ncbi:MAG: glyoxylase-like metal-dependent hydrolase (beta-lactamase superfamily II) [Granulosicoccus sp.]
MSSLPHKHAGLTFPFADKPADGRGIRVAESIEWFRLSLPFALDHVNCWLLGELGDHVLVDTGVADEDSRSRWQKNLSKLSSGASIPSVEKLLITHFHPDHMGLAGWFQQAECCLLGTKVETDFARLLWHIEDQDYADFYADWYRANGLPDSTIAAVRRNSNTYKKLVCQPPSQDAWTLLEEGEHIVLGGHEYEVMIGRGHAPDMIMLYRAADHVLIAADQVLPSITPNVSVMPRSEDSNPLKSFLDCLLRLRELPEDTLVLPSHGDPFRGLWAKLDALAVHHDQRLEEVLGACGTPQSAFDLFGVLFRRELDAQQTSFALGESLAHLHYLESNGQLQRQVKNGVDYFIRA